MESLDPHFASIRVEQLPGATRRPHVCFVAPNIWPVFSGDPDIAVAGGAEVQQSILARLLARSGYRVSIICSDWGQPARVVLNGITIIKTYRIQAGIPILRFIHPRLTGIWRALHQVNADIYYQRAADMVTAVVATYCRRHRKHSVYAAASNTDFIPGQQLIQYRRDRWLFEHGLAKVDAVVVQNEEQKRLCAEHYDRNATLIPSCYELPDGANPGRGDYVLWVAAMRRAKRPELLFEMARRLPHRRFVMIGGPADTKPAELEYFEDMRRAAGALPNVEFAGFLPLQKVEPYFDSARVVVNTSDVNCEGMPNVFLQAWARGVPTVSFNDTGSRLDGDTFYPVVKDIATATAAIERIFGDDLFRARTSHRCLDYFTRTHGTAGVLAHYQRLFQALERGNDR
jgi:glycosyltransferase involved in cell wall biosynthesis